MQLLAMTRAQARRTNFYCTTALVLVLSSPALATAQPTVQPAEPILDIPSQPLASALQSFSVQTGSQVMFSPDAVAGRDAPPVKGRYSPEQALAILIKGSGLTVEHSADRVYLVKAAEAPVRVAQATKKPAAPALAPSLETVVVTAQKKEENIQTVPIAITALSQQQLTDRQIAGGPDLLKSVPNMDFTKTNFSGYNIELRGIGTQAISVTTDPAVAVAFNGTPFIRNHFFEQEFYDLGDAEVLLGPQGTLYGRNATAGVVNLKSALPTDAYEAVLSADIGNYNNRRYEGMLNIPIVGDKLDVRIAGEWTKRDGYTEDTTLGVPVDGRDLWSGRVTIGWKPTSDLQTYFVWEHFSEDDDRLRSGKQLCETDNPPTEVGGQPVSGGTLNASYALGGDSLSQGCKPTSLYSPTAFQVPYGFSLPFLVALGESGGINTGVDPYASTVQSTNLRDIQSAILPTYKAKNDTLEFNAAYDINPALTLTSQTGYNQDFLWSSEDYNRFDTTPGVFAYPDPAPALGQYGLFPDPAGLAFCGDTGCPTGGLPPGAPCKFVSGNSDDCMRAAIFCDPQLGCSDRIVAEDLSDERAWQLSQEIRLTSNFSGPLNFSAGGNYLHYETEENYYVFINALTAYARRGFGGDSGGSGLTSDNSDCIHESKFVGGWQNLNPLIGGGEPEQSCDYVDPNPIGSLNNEGHNYFLSQNPYVLNSYAGFGEVYYNVANDLKLTGGLRWTEDKKHFIDIPSEVITQGYGYPVTGVVNQSWGRFTGRAVADWTPQLDFTDQTLVYASYAHGYKAGGANPPGAEFVEFGLSSIPFPIHPLTFKPEYIEAFELGTKNTLLDNTLTLNGDIFYYNYTGYQISEIVDRTAINNNYNAHVEGAEVTANWEPAPGLKFNFAGGWEDTAAAGGDAGIDLMDRTAGMPGWMVVKPFPTQASNCILPTYVVQALLEENRSDAQSGGAFACGMAYIQHLDPVTLYPYMANPSGTGGIGYGGATFPIPSGYPGFNPNNPVINNGEGFAKNLSGHALPNAPPFTLSLGSEYSLPVSEDWVATARADFYWQADSWARIFNDNPYDRLRGYDTLNLSLILNSANGWSVMAYVKNVFDVTAITGDFLNSDDSGLTTNIFLTDPRLFGVRVTKQLDQADGFWGSDYNGYDFFTNLFSDADGGKPPLWIELGGQIEHVAGQGAVFSPDFLSANPASSVIWKGTTPTEAQQPPLFSAGEEAKISFQPDDTDWVISGAMRIGRSGSTRDVHHQTYGKFYLAYKYGEPSPPGEEPRGIDNFVDTKASRSEFHEVMDFSAGKDVGLGMFGLDGLSDVSLGLRYAQFASKSNVDIRARPDLKFQYITFGALGYPGFEIKRPYFHTYHASGQASRKFRGIGPSISWDASEPLSGGQPNGITFDWGANAAVLFGRQKTRVRQLATAHYAPPHFLSYGGYSTAYPPRAGGHNSSRTVVVPNLGGFAGISYRYANAKISFGYRADLFFGAIDGGIDKRHSETVNMGGPFATISFGLGG